MRRWNAGKLFRVPTPPVPPALEVSGLRFSVPGRQIIDGVDLTVPTGSITALLGPNGAGKTTLIRCCATIYSPTAGTVLACGETPARAIGTGKLAVMPQATGAWSGVKPLQLLTYLARLHTHPLPVAALASRLGIDDFANTFVRRLSGGQQQALNLAAALVGRPELVFLDEPSAGLDPHSRRSVWELLTDLRAAGVSILLTTHGMDEAERLADYIHIMDRGRIAVRGTPSELMADGQSLESVYLANTEGGMRP